MDATKEAQLRIMLKKEGKTHLEINSIVEQFKESERQELEAQEAQQKDFCVEETETEISEEEQLKAKLKNLRESKKAERERARQEQEENLNQHKHEVLTQIEERLLEKEKVLNGLTLENSKLRTELNQLILDAQKHLSEDRLSEREIYRKTLSTFYDSLFSILSNFADSQTEKSLILLFSREGSTIGLKTVQSTKAVLTKDDLKVKGVSD